MRRQIRHYIRCKETGKCTSCGVKLPEDRRGLIRCISCATKDVIGHKYRREAHIAAGLCEHCAQPRVTARHCEYHRIRQNELTRMTKIKKRKLGSPIC